MMHHPQGIKAECERIWSELPLQFPMHKAGWLPREYQWLKRPARWVGGCWLIKSAIFVSVRGVRYQFKRRAHKIAGERYTQLGLELYRQKYDDHVYRNFNLKQPGEQNDKWNTYKRA